MVRGTMCRMNEIVLSLLAVVVGADAAGTVFGGGSLIHIRPNSRHFDLSEPDEIWQDFADEYIACIAASILNWGGSSREAAKPVLGYDDWLVKTERREPLSKRSSRPSPDASARPAASDPATPWITMNPTTSRCNPPRVRATSTDGRTSTGRRRRVVTRTGS